MKKKLFKITCYIFCAFFLLEEVSCFKAPLEPTDDAGTPISQIVAGSYSGNGKYMPFLSVPLDLPSGSTSCYIPTWEFYLKNGTGNAIVSSINDSTINIFLTGAIYTNSFNKNFILSKNGNVISDATGKVQFFIDSKSLQFSYQVPSGAPLLLDCIPVSKYYFVHKNVNNRYYCYSLETWELDATK